MKKNVLRILSLIILICTMLVIFVACEADDVQMDMMAKGYYTLRTNKGIKDAQFDVIDSDVLWSIEASKGMYELLNEYKEGDVKTPFELVTIIKFKDTNSAANAVTPMRDKISNDGYVVKNYKGIEFPVQVVVEQNNDFLYVGTVEAIKTVKA